VTAPATTSPVDAALASGGQIAGTVTAPGGAVAAGVQVCALYTGNCGFTNASGEYTIPGLIAGKYEVIFYSSEGSHYAPQYYKEKPSSTGDEPVSVTVPDTTTGIDAEMHPGAEIAGQVTAASGGAGVAGVLVCAEGTNVVWRTCTDTAAGGGYALYSLPGGTYKVEFLPNESESFELHETPNVLKQIQEGVSVAAGGTRSEVDVALASGGQISGTVTAASGGAAPAKI